MMKLDGTGAAPCALPLAIPIATSMDSSTPPGITGPFEEEA